MLPWYFEDVAVDPHALANLQQVALQAAAHLDAAARRRVRSAAQHLARCSGPFADDLADHAIRLACRHRELAAALIALATATGEAAEQARWEQTHRVALREQYKLTQAALGVARGATTAVGVVWSPTAEPTAASIPTLGTAR